MGVRVVVPALLALGAGTALVGCFLGFDSNWGAAKRAQRHLAEAGPAVIETRDEGASEGIATKRTWHVRFRPNATYLAQTVDAPKQLADLVEDATAILEPALGLRLEVDRIEPWPLESDDDLHAALAALERSEPGEGADLVVGLVGALPHQTDSLHEAGLATLLGKHVVLRAASRGGEYDSIDRTFDELRADERAKILKQRKRHRALAVFLHEVGHCLGAIHDGDPRSLMSRTYGPKAAELEPGTVALMRVALDAGDKTAIARGQLQILEGTATNEWLPVERDAQIVALRGFVGPARASLPSAPSPPLAAPLPTPDESLSGLDAADRARFSRAQQLFQAGAVAPAYESALPLFARYPRSLGVQDFRCQLATVRWLPRKEMQTECAPAQALHPAVDAGR